MDDLGPNNWAATFTYPPAPGPNDKFVLYNYKDTVNVSWISWPKNSTPTTMQIYYWDPTLQNTGWQGLSLDEVARNGSKVYNMNLVKNNVGWFLGQWNLNFTRADNAPAVGLTLSPQFNCTFDDSLPAKSYNLDSAAASSSPSSPTSAAASETQAGVTATSATAATSSGADLSPLGNAAGATATGSASAGLSGGAIAGVVIGVLAAVILAAAGGFFLWRRKRAARAGTAAPGPAPDAGGPADHTYAPSSASPASATTQTPAMRSLASPVSGAGHGYSPVAAAADAPQVYAAPGSDWKQPVVGTSSNHEYYNKALPPMQVDQGMVYNELPGTQPFADDRPRTTEMPGSVPLRQELPG